MEAFTEKTKRTLNAVEEILKVRLKNKRLLLSALTHRSYLQTHGAEDPCEDYEVLEFCGDRLLSYLLHRYMVRVHKVTDLHTLGCAQATLMMNQVFSDIAKAIGLTSHIRATEHHLRQNPKIAADVLEAVFAAVDHDKGAQVAESLFVRLFKGRVENLLNRQRFTPMLYANLLVMCGELSWPVPKLDTRQYGSSFEAKVESAENLLGAAQHHERALAEERALENAYKLVLKKLPRYSPTL